MPAPTRAVPADKKRDLTRMSAQQLCDLVPLQQLQTLAFPVGEGKPSDSEAARGCEFASQDSRRSVLISAQPSGYERLGEEAVLYGHLPASKVLRANDCTVLTAVHGGTLQVVVTAKTASAEQCGSAEAVTRYALPELVTG